ncbi:MAG TPA: hypothetical protein VI072_25795 [Polyangiaceae bacterium]
MKLEVGISWLLAASAGALSGCAYDVNLDSKVRVACIGDSNTAPAFGNVCVKLTERYKPQDEAVPIAEWGMLFQTYARAGSTAIDDPPGAPEDAQGQLNRALAGAVAAPECVTPEFDGWEACDFASSWDKFATNARPDVVVFASGTNDIPKNTTTAPQIYARLVQLKALAESAGVKALVATIPPRCSCTTNPDGTKTCVPGPWTAKIDAVNAALRADTLLSGRLLELNAGFTCSEHLSNTDGVHVTTAGNALRFERANAIVTREIDAAIERIRQ